MLTKIKQSWNSLRVRGHVPLSSSPSKPTPYNDKEIIFACVGQETNKVILMLHSHALWIGQNNIELENFTSGWQKDGIVRYCFKTKKEAIHFKLVWG